MTHEHDFKKKLNASDKEVRNYIIELEKENRRLHNVMAKLRVKVTSLENEIKETKKAQPKLKITTTNYGDKR